MEMLGKEWSRAKILTVKVVNIAAIAVCWAFVLLCIYVVLSVLVFSTFRVPTESMEPTLKPGDDVMVFKPALGARLFDLFAAANDEQVIIHRLPGVRNIRRNDVLIFNYPYPNGSMMMQMDILKYYVKRCVALPGDTLRIVNGFYRVTGVEESLGNAETQKRLSLTSDSTIRKDLFETLPYDSPTKWNIKHFGPLFVPKAGSRIMMDSLNFTLYRKLISWEQQQTAVMRGGKIYLGHKLLPAYTFAENYYFVAGDNFGSDDSRYWGLLPEEFIVGKAWLIWHSVDLPTGKIRWKRCFRIVR